MQRESERGRDRERGEKREKREEPNKATGYKSTPRGVKTHSMV